MSVKYLLQKIKNLLEEEKRIHYTRIAALLEISPSYARVLARMLAEKEPDHYRYDKGVLSLVEK